MGNHKTPKQPRRVQAQSTPRLWNNGLATSGNAAARIDRLNVFAANRPPSVANHKSGTGRHTDGGCGDLCVCVDEVTDPGLQDVDVGDALCMREDEGGWEGDVPGR